MKEQAEHQVDHKLEDKESENVRRNYVMAKKQVKDRIDTLKKVSMFCPYVIRLLCFCVYYSTQFKFLFNSQLLFPLNYLVGN